jgi:hypothetical protein
VQAVTSRRPAKARAVWEDERGDPIAPTGAVTATVTDALGTAYAPVAATVEEDGTALAQLPTAALNEVGLLSVAWTGGPYPLETTVEVQGGRYVTLGDLRRVKALRDPRFSDLALSEALRVAETTVESFCGVAFVPRFQRELVDGHGDCELVVSKLYVRRVLAAWVDGEQVEDADAWLGLAGGGLLTAQAIPWGTRNVDVAFVHGHLVPPPDLAAAVVLIVQELLLGSLNGLPERATSLTTDGVTYSIAQAGRDRPTGIPAVDETLRRYREGSVLVG